jgi:tetratricopeptide (TPR) repeat protein
MRKSIELAPNFAPAYLGRARCLLMINPAANVLEDLDLAIEYDPNLSDAYLVRAEYLLDRNDSEAAIDDLLAVQDLYPESPLLHVLLARAHMETGENELALQSALRAYELDKTSCRLIKPWRWHIWQTRLRLRPSIIWRPTCVTKRMTPTAGCPSAMRSVCPGMITRPL